MKRTNLYAAVAVALAMPAPAFGASQPKEELFSPFFKGPGVVDITSRGVFFAGKTTITSGGATGSTSSTLVSTGWLVLTAQAVTPGAVSNASSGAGKIFEVKTLCEGSFVTFGSTDGIGVGKDVDIHWFALRTF